MVTCRVTMNQTREANCFLVLDKGKTELRNSLQYDEDFVDFPHFKWTPLEAASSKGSRTSDAVSFPLVFRSICWVKRFGKAFLE